MNIVFLFYSVMNPSVGSRTHFKKIHKKNMKNFNENNLLSSPKSRLVLKKIKMLKNLFFIDFFSLHFSLKRKLERELWNNKVIVAIEFKVNFK